MAKSAPEEKSPPAEFPPLPARSTRGRAIAFRAVLCGLLAGVTVSLSWAPRAPESSAWVRPERTGSLPAPEPSTAEPAVPVRVQTADAATTPAKVAMKPPPLAVRPEVPARAESSIRATRKPAADSPAAERVASPPRQPKLINAGIYAPDPVPVAAEAGLAPSDLSTVGYLKHREVSILAVAATVAVPVPHGAWSKIRQGMSKEDVAWLIGDPRWTERSVAFEFWMYEVKSSLASGVIVFENGQVFSWREPVGPIASR